MRGKQFHVLANNLHKIHEDYHALIEDEYELRDSEEYLLIETQRIDNFKRTIADWIDSLLDKTRAALDREINSNDSISIVDAKAQKYGKPASSVASSRRSRSSSAMAAASAKKAMLRVQAPALSKYRALEEEELQLKREMLMLNQRQEENRLRLQQRKEELQLETEIAKADAEERAYARTMFNDDYPPFSEIAPEGDAWPEIITALRNYTRLTLLKLARHFPEHICKPYKIFSYTRFIIF